MMALLWTCKPRSRPINLFHVFDNLPYDFITDVYPYLVLYWAHQAASMF